LDERRPMWGALVWCLLWSVQHDSPCFVCDVFRGNFEKFSQIFFEFRDLERNHLEGQIVPSLGNLSNIEELCVSLLSLSSVFFCRSLFLIENSLISDFLFSSDFFQRIFSVEQSLTLWWNYGVSRWCTVSQIFCRETKNLKEIKIKLKEISDQFFS